MTLPKVVIFFLLAYCALSRPTTKIFVHTLTKDMVHLCEEKLPRSICQEIKAEEHKLVALFQDLDADLTEPGIAAVSTVLSHINMLVGEIKSVGVDELLLGLLKYAFGFDRSTEGLVEGIKGKIQAVSDIDIEEYDGKLYVASTPSNPLKPPGQQEMTCDRMSSHELKHAERKGHAMLKQNLRLAIEYIAELLESDETANHNLVKRGRNLVFAARLLGSATLLGIGIYVMITWIPLIGTVYYSLPECCFSLGVGLTLGGCATGLWTLMARGSEVLAQREAELVGNVATPLEGPGS
ncbi:hypothetical protein MP638_006293 [Amoeboaphelidium occidentale]|nr:hypothetical protein MP638_006293 [Amoeboaphelidium occidentale]